jgi:hypothetical protein
MTTVFKPGRDFSTSARASSSVRNTRTFSFPVPAIGGTKALLPVARISLWNSSHAVPYHNKHLHRVVPNHRKIRSLRK